MALLERDVQFFTSSLTSGWDSTNTRKLRINGGYAFNQSVNAVKVYRENLSPIQSRGYTSSYVSDILRADASITQYLTPRSDGDCAERPFWIGLTGSANGTSFEFPNKRIITFANSNLKKLQEGTIWFGYPNSETMYRLDNTVVESADIQFNIDSFPTVTWKVTGNNYLDLVGGYTSNVPAHTDTTNEKRCIIGKLSTTTIVIGGETYELGLVSGSIGISNSVRYLGRKRLGRVATYENHYTGVRNVSGEMQIYLHTGNNLGKDLLNLLLSNKDVLDQLPGVVTIKLGGATGSRVELTFPKVIFDLPQVSTSSVLTLNLSFSAFETSVGQGNEVGITYYS
jgi:hypothetical protein